MRKSLIFLGAFLAAACAGAASCSYNGYRYNFCHFRSCSGPKINCDYNGANWASVPTRCSPNILAQCWNRGGGIYNVAVGWGSMGTCTRTWSCDDIYTNYSAGFCQSGLGYRTVQVQVGVCGRWYNTGDWDDGTDVYECTHQAPVTRTIRYAAYDVNCCTPRTCAANYAGRCGTFSNGCGGNITCGCAAGRTCDAGGYCQSPAPAYTDLFQVQCAAGRQTIAGSLTETSPLHIRKGASVYYIALVSEGDANQSCVKIQTSAGPKRLRKQ